MRMRASGVLVMAAIGSSALFGQSFEVVSVKPGDPTSRRSGDFRVLPGGRLEVTDLTLGILIREAFDVKRYQISGGPKWLETDRFDISARAAAESSRDQMMLMMQGALVERFKLAVRRETHEGNVYVLVAAKSGPKLKRSDADQSFVRLYRNTPPELAGVSYSITGQKVSMALLAERLGELQLGRPVLDRTGIKGEFDIKFDYAIDDNPETGASIFTAIQEQLGLKLQAAKGPVDMLIIEHAQKPSAN